MTMIVYRGTQYKYANEVSAVYQMLCVLVYNYNNWNYTYKESSQLNNAMAIKFV